MLQKLLVVIVGLVMSVVGALSPAGLFASQNAGETPDLAANTAEEMLSTLRTSDGQAFARVSVLWVEVDGKRITEDAWGTGALEEIRFKVGVKDVDAVALAVGDKIVNLHPTDIITVRMFRGDFSYRGLGTPLASVQLQGSVKTTVLKEGDITNRVLTQQEGGLDLAGVRSANTRPGDDTRVAYVVLTTGEKVDTVAVEDGGARLYTEEASVAAEAKNEPGNLLAKWVKIDGKLVREYTWGDGSLKKVELEPAEAASKSVVLAFNGEVSEVSAGERVVIEDFVGEYLIYQVSGGMMRVRLDGYAGRFDTGMSLPIPTIGGEGAPLASFEYRPAAPKTTDTIQFTDTSNDDGGIIVFQKWDFGDNTSAVLATPTHRFARPGSYDVVLSVTDNDLKTTNTTQTILVRNTEPVSDFDFSPKVVTTDTMVSFTDQSFDSDGTIVDWSWDFGDGVVEDDRHPAHRFERGGNLTVTLTTTDELGARTSLSKVILVRNSPPSASFTFSPSNPLTLDPVQFVNTSTDTDGDQVSWNWSFGDNTFGSGSSPVHPYARPGTYTVTMTVFDDAGDSDTASTTVTVENRPPFADFVWSPVGEPANVPVVFSSTSTDPDARTPDGRILSHSWDFGDGSARSSGSSATHTFPRAGSYLVTLTVTDDALGVSNVTQLVTVANSAPRANFAMTPNPAFRATEVRFSDSSLDPDGEAIVNWTWDFGDGAFAHGRTASHVYTTMGNMPVTLHVRDASGTESMVSRSIRILNRAPSVMMEITPRSPFTGEDVTFEASGVDPDAPSESILFEWTFSDGVQRIGPSVTRNFTTAGNYSVTLRGRDVDGGLSSPVILGIVVQPARPVIGFSWSPQVPTPGQVVQFRDESIPAPDAPIREWRWTFGTGAGATSQSPNPTFAFPANGTFDVTLVVTDVRGLSNATTQRLEVNLKPSARFTAPDGIIALGQPVGFTDASTDDDGFVSNWTWNFGDGNVSYARHPTHEFGAPGNYNVLLTVRDDDNATDTSLPKTLRVANRAPVARWGFTTNNLAQERGVPFYFSSTDSYDPDGQSIAAHSWSFGDGSISTLPDPTHVFTRSGPHTVGLVVNDGDANSLRTQESHQTIHVAADHDVVLKVRGMLPGERVADLTRPEYAVSVRQGLSDLQGVIVAPNGTGLDITIDDTLWVNNTRFTVRVSAPFLSQPADQSVTLRDGVLSIPVVLNLRLNIDSVLVPFSGQNPTVLPEQLGGADNISGDPLYRDMRENPRGTGTLTFSDDTPAVYADVTVEARWVPLRAVSFLRDDQTLSSIINQGLLGWCSVAFARTDSAGAFEWEFDGQRPCVTNSVDGGLYPLGRWEVRARPALDPQNTSPVRAFYVDPTGGILMTALAGLA